jgi:hypothetical protein
MLFSIHEILVRSHELVFLGCDDCGEPLIFLATDRSLNRAQTQILRVLYRGRVAFLKKREKKGIHD